MIVSLSSVLRHHVKTVLYLISQITSQYRLCVIFRATGKCQGGCPGSASRHPEDSCGAHSTAVFFQFPHMSTSTMTQFLSTSPNQAVLRSLPKHRAITEHDCSLNDSCPVTYKHSGLGNQINISDNMSEF
jgi:hypothetical protein